ncbi:MAG: hypothetical protein ACPG1A_16690 [Halioglobus sp.]
MAAIWNVFKTFRPRTTILSNDFNAFQATLKAAFDKLGSAAGNGLLGVSTPFAVGTPTDDEHAVNLGTMNNNIDTLVAGALVGEQAQAQQSADAAEGFRNEAEQFRDQAEAIRDETQVIRFTDANALAFFFGNS